MTNNRTSTFIRVVLLALLTAVASVGLLSAEDSKGTFTLPFEVRWGKAVLPAGDYSFKIDNTNYVITIRGENLAAMVLSPTPSPNKHAGSSELIIARQGKQGTVRALRLAEQNVVFSYPALRGEPPMLAQTPELLQRVPILFASK